MADNVGYTPGSGATVAADEIDGVLHQRVKLTIGADGVNSGDVSSSNPLPITAPTGISISGTPNVAVTNVPSVVVSGTAQTIASNTDNLLVMLSRIVKLLESNAIIDSAQRQRIVIDAGTLTTVTTCSTVTSLTNMVSNAGMDREQFINIAKQTYAQSIRSRLDFV